jgi:hypothetical protein
MKDFTFHCLSPASPPAHPTSHMSRGSFSTMLHFYLSRSRELEGVIARLLMSIDP